MLDIRNPLGVKAEDVWSSHEDVERARRDLGLMEERLKSVVKRQRQAVQNSELGIATETPIDPVPGVGRTFPAKSIFNEAANDEASDIELAPFHNCEAERAHGDMLDATTEQRNARRPLLR